MIPRSTDGQFMNKTYGGKGDRSQHGKFSTNHGCTYDSRLKEPTIIVSDRANSRLEFFSYDPTSIDKFDYYKTVDLRPSMGEGTLPCNVRLSMTLILSLALCCVLLLIITTYLLLFSSLRAFSALKRIREG